MLENIGQKRNKNTDNTKLNTSQKKQNDTKHSKTKLAWFGRFL